MGTIIDLDHKHQSFFVYISKANEGQTKLRRHKIKENSVCKLTLCSCPQAPSNQLTLFLLGKVYKESNTDCQSQQGRLPMSFIIRWCFSGHSNVLFHEKCSKLVTGRRVIPPPQNGWVRRCVPRVMQKSPAGFARINLTSSNLISHANRDSICTWDLWALMRRSGFVTAAQLTTVFIVLKEDEAHKLLVFHVNLDKTSELPKETAGAGKKLTRKRMSGTEQRNKTRTNTNTNESHPSHKTPCLHQIRYIFWSLGLETELSYEMRKTQPCLLTKPYLTWWQSLQKC